jgi:hypothetical protein
LSARERRGLALARIEAVATTRRGEKIMLALKVGRERFPPSHFSYRARLFGPVPAEKVGR